MRPLAVVTFILAVSAASPAQTQSFVGEWTATAHLNGFGTSESLSVVRVEDGYRITAEVVGAPPGAPNAGPGTDIAIQGDHFSFKRILMFDGNSIELAYEGVVSGDTFTGTADVGSAKVPYTGVRKEAFLGNLGGVALVPADLATRSSARLPGGLSVRQ